MLEETGDCEGMPKRFCHLRDSERMVRDDVYLTCANLLGRGLSIDESADATVIVGKGMFKRTWKTRNESQDTIDVNTMPHYRNILDKVKLIEAQSLSLVVEEVMQKPYEGRMIPHAIDSTTKKRVGTFAC